MARAAFPIADRVSLADVGEYMKRKSDFLEGLACDDVQNALVDGCGVELRWFKEGREVCREYPEPDFWHRPILVWHGVLPRRLHVQLPPEEQKGDQLVTFLRLTDAVQRGLYSASESPQAKQQSEPQQPPPATQPDEPASAVELEPSRVEPVPSSPKLSEPPPEEAEQQRSLLFLPDEPQFEGPRKWRPEEGQVWLENAKQIHPRKPRETKSAYARRLYEHMKNDFGEDIPWTGWETLRRRLNDPSIEDG
jgi:hypothetical protein